MSIWCGSEKGRVDDLGSAGKSAPLFGDVCCVRGWVGEVKACTQSVFGPLPNSKLLQRAKKSFPSTSISSWEGNVAMDLLHHVRPTSLGLRASPPMFSRYTLSPYFREYLEIPSECSFLPVHVFFSTSYSTITSENWGSNFCKLI